MKRLRSGCLYAALGLQTIGFAACESSDTAAIDGGTDQASTERSGDAGMGGRGGIPLPGLGGDVGGRVAMDAQTALEAGNGGASMTSSAGGLAQGGRASPVGTGEGGGGVVPGMGNGGLGVVGGSGDGGIGVVSETGASGGGVSGLGAGGRDGIGGSADSVGGSVASAGGCGGGAVFEIGGSGEKGGTTVMAGAGDLVAMGGNLANGASGGAASSGGPEGGSEDRDGSAMLDASVADTESDEPATDASVAEAGDASEADASAPMVGCLQQGDYAVVVTGQSCKYTSGSPMPGCTLLRLSSGDVACCPSSSRVTLTIDDGTISVKSGSTEPTVASEYIKSDQSAVTSTASGLRITKAVSTCIYPSDGYCEHGGTLGSVSCHYRNAEYTLDVDCTKGQLALTYVWNYPCSSLTGLGASLSGIADLCQEPSALPKRCRGSIPQFCSDQHIWEEVSTGQCPADRPLCRDGQCMPASMYSAKQLGTGRTHVCVLFGNGQVKCWGGNESGQLGLGDLQNRGKGPDEMGSHLQAIDLGVGRTATAIAVGNAHTCAILDNRQVKCWGLNASGQLGLGDTRNRGDWPGDMGDNLAAIELGTGRTAVRITAGRNHTCALLDDNTLKCWGGNESGQLGLGDTQNRGDDPSEMGDSLPAVQLGTGLTVTDVQSGPFSAHTCAMTGGAKCWGANGSGQLGLGDTANRGDGPDEMGDNLLATGHWDVATGSECTCGTAGANPTIECAGSGGTCRSRSPNSSDWLPVLFGYRNSRLTFGATHACTSQGPACWGNAGRGAMGTAQLNQLESGDLSPIDLRDAKAVTAISAGDQYTCVINNGDVQCWGANDQGQLGLGDTIDRAIGGAQRDVPPVSLW